MHVGNGIISASLQDADMFLIWAPSSCPRQMEMLGQLGKCLCSQRGKKESCCFCSVAKSCPALCHPMDCSMPGSSVLHYFPEFAQIHVPWVGDAIWPSHPLSPLLFLPSIFPSIRDFSNESALCIRWPKCWSFNFSISPSNEYSGLIFFTIDWFDLLAVQGTLKSLLQQYNWKASILWCSVFFMVQISHPDMNTGKTLALTIQTSVGKVIFVFSICCLGLSYLSLQGASAF